MPKRVNEPQERQHLKGSDDTVPKKGERVKDGERVKNRVTM